jgi:hypothetical protein
MPNGQDKGAAITTKGAAFTIPKTGVEDLQNDSSKKHLGPLPVGYQKGPG